MKYFDSILSFLVTIAGLIWGRKENKVCKPRSPKANSSPFRGAGGQTGCLPDDHCNPGPVDGGTGSGDDGPGSIADEPPYNPPERGKQDFPPSGEVKGADLPFIIGCLLMAVGSTGFLLKYVG